MCCWQKAIEKTILSVLGSNAFSHSLGQKRKPRLCGGMSALPGERTSSGCLGMSEKCHKRTHARSKQQVYSITSSAPTRPGRRNPTTSKAASVFSPDRCRCNRASTAMNLLRLCRDECHKAIPVRHTYLRQRLGIHRVVLSDDAVELQDIGGHCVEFVIGQRFRFVVRH